MKIQTIFKLFVIFLPVFVWAFFSFFNSIHSMERQTIAWTSNSARTALFDVANILCEVCISINFSIKTLQIQCNYTGQNPISVKL